MNRRLFQVLNKSNKDFRRNISFKMTENNSNLTVRSTAASGSQVYESKRAVYEYLLFHYGNKNDIFPYALGPIDALEFPARSAKICNNYVKTNSFQTRALDIGCAVGGSSFELSKSYDEVIGIDFSQHFIDAANEMKQNGIMKFDVLIRGDVYKTCETNLSDSINRQKVTFQQGDACNLSSELGMYSNSFQIIYNIILCNQFDIM